MIILKVFFCYRTNKNSGKLKFISVHLAKCFVIEGLDNLLCTDKGFITSLDNLLSL